MKWSSTVKVECPSCGSGDCNDTKEACDVLGMEVVGHTIFCNSCGYTKRRLLHKGKEIFKEM